MKQQKSETRAAEAGSEVDETEGDEVGGAADESVERAADKEVREPRARLLPVVSVVAVAEVGAPLMIVGRALRDEKGLIWD